MLDALGRLAVAGARCDVAAAHPGRGRLALPGYAFERRRHWAGGVAAAGDPLIGVRRPETGAIVYEATWSPGAAGVLRDHTVHGRVVVSGAVTSAAALAALRAAGVEGRRVVEAVEFTAPLTLDGPRRVELRLVARGGGHDFEVATLDPRRLHLRGRIGHHETPPPPPVELAAVRARCVETIAGDDFYARFWDPARHHLGPSYRLIQTIWRRDGEALARLRPPPADPGLDAARAAEIGAAEVAGQLLMPAVPDFERVFAAVGHTFLGAGMARSVEHGAGPAVWVYARLGHVDEGGFGGDVALLAADGAVCVSFEGLAVRRITEAVVRPTAAAFELGPVDGRRARLLAHLRGAVTALAGTADPDVDAPLSQLGFDSLMTLDLAERLAGAGLAVGAADALRDLSLAELVDRALATAAAVAARRSSARVRRSCADDARRGGGATMSRRRGDDGAAHARGGSRRARAHPPPSRGPATRDDGPWRGSARAAARGASSASRTPAPGRSRSRRGALICRPRSRPTPPRCPATPAGRRARRSRRSRRSSPTSSPGCGRCSIGRLSCSARASAGASPSSWRARSTARGCGGRRA
ncbi:MAG: polyketide synthase dehydratase domain-containing protein [Myxococcales bacterium]|nr:polyketide synthase dehydratase domain-containing protein [Myxococcales bacterium]